MDSLRDLEVITVSLKCRYTKLLLSLIYRPPGQSDANDKTLYRELTNALNNKNAVIMGDFNCPDLCNSIMPTNNESRNLLKFIEDNFLTQTVLEPTRGNNILDLVLTSNENFIENLFVREPLGNSDHNMIEFEINIKSESKVNCTKVPNFRRANFDRFRERVSEIPWNMFRNKSINEQWGMLMDTILSAQNESVPFKRKRIGNKNNPKWYSVEIGG